MSKRILLLGSRVLALLALLSSPVLAEQPAPIVRGQIDWQGHPAMHITWPMFGKGLTDREPRLRNRHMFNQVATAPYIERAGIRIHLWAAMAAERARNPDQARRMVLRQLRYVEDFVDANSDRFALARTPAQARDLLQTTDKQVVVHAIEGGRELFDRQDDAAFWAAQGVALVTVAHLFDDGLVAAALNPGLTGSLTNLPGVRKRKRDLPRGLTPRGREVIVELADAGILVDLTHMAPEAVAETLDLTREHGIPPVVTHGKLSRLRDTERAFTDAQVVDIYQQGGAFNLVLAGNALVPDVDDLSLPDDHCPGTIDDFRLHWLALRDIIASHRDEILAAQGASDADPQDAAVRLATGWASDWNGWTNHTEPKYGRGDCMPLDALPDPPLEFDTRGLAHPGLLPQHWQRLEESGVDLDPMLLSAEQFLRLWEAAVQRRD